MEPSEAGQAAEDGRQLRPPSAVFSRLVSGALRTVKARCRHAAAGPQSAATIGSMDAAPLIEVTAFTHRGLVRDGNEDSITVAGWVSDVAMSGLRRSRHELTEPVLCAVADGMGGHAAGEIASRYAIKRLAAEPFAGSEASA